MEGWKEESKTTTLEEFSNHVLTNSSGLNIETGCQKIKPTVTQSSDVHLHGSNSLSALMYSSIYSSSVSLGTICKSSSMNPHSLDPALPQGSPEKVQSIVPQILIDYFVSMSDPSRAQTVDNDISRHCAFSFPAVAVVLGRTNWALLKKTYEILANDMQWKVRYTLACSIHEVGVILGEDFASTDLVPIFNGFIKDLDEVHIGILRHLADFLTLLNDNTRKEYLPKLGEFLKVDNKSNWRFRQELTEQLSMVVPLYKADDIIEFIAPIVLSLIQDKISEVRHGATHVIVILLKTLCSSEDSNPTQAIVTNLIECLAKNSHWAMRQTFVVLSGKIITTLANEVIIVVFLSHLLDLVSDVVSNVRLKVAQILSGILQDEFHNNLLGSKHTAIRQAFRNLASDEDKDVREIVCQVDKLIVDPSVIEANDAEERS